MSKGRTVYIGADPELFIHNSKTGRFVSAFGKLPGTKQNPDWIGTGAIQVDGTAAEFNILPCTTKDQFVTRIREVTENIQQRLHKMDVDWTLTAIPTAEYDPEYFRSLPEAAKLMGCDPDFDAWNNGIANNPPDQEVTYRTGGGHIHVGWTKDVLESDITHFHDCIEITKQLDAVLYSMSLLWDKDTKRRTLYGKMGAFRPKHYGAEYRSLSNAWVADPALASWIFESTVLAEKLLREEGYKLFENELFVSLGESPSNMQLKEYHAELSDYDFPALPRKYL